MDELVQAYEKDILKYLQDKLPDEKLSTVMEIASFIDSKTAVLMCNVVRERDAGWSAEVRKINERWESEFRNLRKFYERKENRQ